MPVRAVLESVGITYQTGVSQSMRAGTPPRTILRNEHVANAVELGSIFP